MPKIVELPLGGSALDTDYIVVGRGANSQTFRLPLSAIKAFIPAGAPGKSLHTGLGPPSEGIGNAEDTYVDVNTGTVYVKG